MAWSGLVDRAISGRPQLSDNRHRRRTRHGICGWQCDGRVERHDGLNAIEHLGQAGALTLIAADRHLAAAGGMSAMNRALRIDTGGSGQSDAPDGACIGAAHRHFMDTQRFGQRNRHQAAFKGGCFRPVKGDAVAHATNPTAQTNVAYRSSPVKFHAQYRIADPRGSGIYRR